ncbi:hypothetical protein B1756_08215 [Natrarchaeobaculum aegyptiacum]|uniref:Uncharacterized protein n=1 Tax=Natrarchaeobaculum aegyptiacum TaxID=745377 RepID=A0A2Z2HWK7_9EURY|nr:hypothetical protein B1756_08215 [Natrarchaeobaculum aegyptiacum]
MAQEPLAHRIERTQLEATIAALERELVASERRRQGVIDQYERLLECRGRGGGEASNENSDDEMSETGTRDRTALRRLFGLGRQ